MTSVPLSEESATSDGLRPVNLRTDLAALADLLEVAFASTMDSSGRGAIREMRTLSRMGAGLSVLQNISDLAQGMSLGYVWVQQGRLVGNVSVYPANAPADLAKAWIIANVAVHPDYQRRGIARRLMQASLDLVQRQSGSKAILQVDADNFTAQRLYERLGFIHERAWTTWRRPITAIRPPILLDSPYITHRTGSEWLAEYHLAQQIYPVERGGLGWLRPLYPGQFRRSLLSRMKDWVNFRSLERLIVRSDDQRRILASMWVENGLMSGSATLTMIVDPQYEGLYDEALLNTVVRRFGTAQALTIEFPTDLTTTVAVLRRYGFSPRREVIHMRWDVR
ncbi:MAG: GNAT family N-acetyltransferase [Chloroflexi bacterium]|nr:GNAT family N-acetyltransferase [Chloroflexota bacterium]